MSPITVQPRRDVSGLPIPAHEVLNHRAMSFWTWAQPFRSHKSAQTVTMESWASEPAVQVQSNPSPAPVSERALQNFSRIKPNPTPAANPSTRGGEGREGKRAWSSRKGRRKPWWSWLSAPRTSSPAPKKPKGECHAPRVIPAPSHNSIVWHGTRCRRGSGDLELVGCWRVVLAAWSLGSEV
jgi:hypothetical protein